MGIKLEDIQVKIEEKGDMVYHKARLQLFVENVMPLRDVDLKNREGQNDYLHHLLRQRVLAHIYGELIDPINELAMMAALSEKTDSRRLQEIRKTIGTVLSGKEKSKILVN